MKSELLSTYGSKHVFVIPRGIALPPCQIRHSSKPLRFIFAGRIEPLKGLDLIITAAKKLVETIPDFTLDIYGDGDEEYLNDCREKIKKSSMEMHFNFLGRYHDVSQILPQYDVLLMPTLAREAFGRIIIEAMAARLIVIATDAYGPSEIISSGTDGFLFKRGSVQSLTDAVLAVQALDIQKLDSIRNNARRKVEEQYEITLVKKHVQHLIEEIAKNPKRGIK
jgi:glycosyltransferase involved in cell wall biosynthesis